MSIWSRCASPETCTHGLSQNGVSVSGNDLSRLEDRPDVLLHLLVGNSGSNGLLHLEDKAQDFLVGESVEGSSESGEGGRVGEERIREGGSDEV